MLTSKRQQFIRSSKWIGNVFFQSRFALGRGLFALGDYKAAPNRIENVAVQCTTATAVGGEPHGVRVSWQGLVTEKHKIGFRVQSYRVGPQEAQCSVLLNPREFWSNRAGVNLVRSLACQPEQDRTIGAMPLARLSQRAVKLDLQRLGPH